MQSMQVLNLMNFPKDFMHLLKIYQIIYASDVVICKDWKLDNFFFSVFSSTTKLSSKKVYLLRGLLTIFFSK